MNRKNKKRLSLLFTLICMVFVLAGCHKKVEEKTEIKTEFSFLNISAVGVYEGELNDSLADGEGSFASTDENKIKVSGNWEKGKLSGKGTIEYLETGVVVEADFKNGLAEGKVICRKKNGEYETFRCKKGVPASKISKYNSAGKIQGIDWFYDSEPIEELKLKAADAKEKYNLILSRPQKYVDEPLKIEGKVMDIFEDWNTQYIKIRDEENNIYICQYGNTVGAMNIQAQVANFRVGDEVVLYGFLEECSIFECSSLYRSSLYKETNLKSISNISLLASNESFLPGAKGNQIIDYELENTLPIITLFAGDFKNTKLNNKQLTFDYEEICTYPYEYLGETQEISADIVRMHIDYDNNKVNMMLRKENTNQLYYCSYDKKENEILFKVGDKIKIKGIIKGNQKIAVFDQDKETYEYVIYPRIYISKILENEK